MERRRFSRALFPSEAYFEWRNRLWPAKIKDLAYGGVYLLSEHKPPVGEEVTVKFYLSGLEPQIEISFLAEVVRHGQDGFAVQIKQVDLRSLGHLRKILYYNLPDPDQAEKELQTLLGEALLEL